ncbi:HNH endonuclease [Paenibacillus ferrarius]|uniref:HNH endonuclease n=1 Tax=Paenibacillus ferrarius TaxID=1469647 RepID=UPI00117C8A7F|nr:AP2 domain-containing protein [Paenibacillus ferrarius]
MKIIVVDGNDVLVDDDDYLFLINCFNLRMEGVYVQCTPKKQYKKMGLRANSLQKLLVLPEKLGRNIVVDHIDGNESNNQKSNLRICTHPENMKNRKKNKTYANRKPTSKYKGVYWYKANQCWLARLNVDNKNVTVGCFSNEIAAASAYNLYAKKYHGEFAKLNDLEKLEMSENEFEIHRMAKNKSSQYIGVCFVDDRWVAQICHKGKNMRIGGFHTEIEAAEAYNNKALELKGEKAKLNMIHA